MGEMLSYAIMIVLSLYCVLLLGLIYGWYSLKECRGHAIEKTNVYSILVPVRNEAEHVARLFKNLQQQDFPAGRFEIIFIDDHSEDGTVAHLKPLVNSGRVRCRILDLKQGRGKKSALQQGIAAAAGSIIVTTDADCSMSAGWLKSISQHFESADTEMVFGPVTFRSEDTIFKKIQTIEFAALIGTGAAGLGLGMPNMCNGANLSFRRESFYNVKGYMGNEMIASGDDEFLMHKIYKNSPSGVSFNRSTDAIVYTHAHGRWGDFFQQRKRWASKWSLYSSLKTVLLALFIFFYNASVLVALGLLIIDFTQNQILLLPLLAKVALEAGLLFAVLRFLGKPSNTLLFIILQFTYPVYVIFFGIAANFGKYTWKGRKH